MFCITVLKLHVLVLWLLQLLLLSGDVETNTGPVCQKCLADLCICNVKVKPRRRPSKRCPACASPVPCRRMICVCGYDFIKCVIVLTPDKASKRKAHRDAVAASRANETPEQSLGRKSKIMNAMATFRANETPEQSLESRKQSKSNMTKLREHQLPEVSARQNLNAKFRMASLRENDSVESSINRVTQSRVCMQRTRHKKITVNSRSHVTFSCYSKRRP